MRWLNRLFIAALICFGLWIVGGLAFIYVWLPFYVRGRPVVVPKFQERTLADARSAATQMGLVVGRVDERPHPTIRRGRVISHLPSPGQRVKQKRPINFIVSSGPEMVEVPDLVRKSVREAEYDIAIRGLLLGRRAYIYSDELPALDTVITSAPPPGARAERSTSVDILLSRGPQSGDYISLVSAEERRLHAQQNDRDSQSAKEPEKTTERDQARAITIAHQVSGNSESEIRVKIIVQDQRGTHELFNGFANGGKDISLPRTIVGKATLYVYEDDMNRPVRQENL